MNNDEMMTRGQQRGVGIRHVNDELRRVDLELVLICLHRQTDFGTCAIRIWD